MTDEKAMKPDKRAALLDAAADLLSNALGRVVTLENPRKLDSQHFMFRCDVAGFDDIPSVILKKMDLEKNDGQGTLRFRNEVASLAFLTGLERETPLAPRLLAQDGNLGMIVMEDLGIHPTIQDLMFGEDETLAEDALVKMGALLGGLHAAARGQEAAFLLAQQTFASSTPLSDSTLDLRTHMDSIQACFDALQVDHSPDFIDELNALEERLQSPAYPWRTFAHCDAGSHNFLYTGDTVRGMDFEFGGYASGLLDAVPARMAFPPSFRGHRVPPEVAMQMENAYRDALIEDFPLAEDDDAFNRAKVEACAHWAFSRIQGLWRDYLQSVVEVGEERTLEELDIPETRIRPFRNKVYTYVTHFVDAAAATDELPGIRKPVKGWLRAMRKMWPDIEVIPLYPVWETITDDDD